MGREVDKMEKDYATLMDEIKANTFGLILTPGEMGWRMEFLTDTPQLVEGETFAQVVEEAYRRVLELDLPA